MKCDSSVTINRIVKENDRGKKWATAHALTENHVERGTYTYYCLHKFHKMSDILNTVHFQNENQKYFISNVTEWKFCKIFNSMEFRNSIWRCWKSDFVKTVIVKLANALSLHRTQ